MAQGQRLLKSLPFRFGAGKLGAVRRLSLSEMALVCAPVSLLVAGPVVFTVMRRNNPPRNPKAKIVLSVARSGAYSSATTSPQLYFGWVAKATNSPKKGIDVKFSEQIVATGHGHSFVVYKAPVLSTAPLTSKSPYYVRSITQASIKGTDLGRCVRLSWDDVPVWADKLEWQGEVVAVPNPAGSSSLPVPATTVRRLARTVGATYIRTRFPLALNRNMIAPVQSCLSVPVKAEGSKRGADTCIKVEFRDYTRRTFRQLSAFDGKTRRVLWSDGANYRNPYWVSKRTSTIPISADFLWFKLRSVPVSWGRITFSLDAVFAPGTNAGGGQQSSNMGAVQELKSKGWIFASRRLVVRH